MKLLNANSYQKGSWVLHMLRRKVGDSSFWKSIRIYYKKFFGRNASTSDLKKVFEKVSHQNLDTFFDQWLYTPGQPKLHIDWQYNKLKKTIDISINQQQQQLFYFPVTILFSNGEKRFTKSFNITDKKENFSIPVSFEPLKMTVDPDVNLLFELQ